MHSGHAAAAALTGGFHWAFIVLGAIGLAAVPATAVLVRQRDLDTAVAVAASRTSTPQSLELTAAA